MTPLMETRRLASRLIVANLSLAALLVAALAPGFAEDGKAPAPAASKRPLRRRQWRPHATGRLLCDDLC